MNIWYWALFPGQIVGSVKKLQRWILGKETGKPDKLYFENVGFSNDENKTCKWKYSLGFWKKKTF